MEKGGTIVNFTHFKNVHQISVYSLCNIIFYLGVVVDLHTRLSVNVLGADNLTVPLQRLQLEELGCRQKLESKNAIKSN